MSDGETKDLFDHLDEVKKGKDPEYFDGLDRESKKKWSSFMIRRFLSMREEYVPVLNELQPLTQHMEDRHVYRLYAELLPYDDGYYKYISSSEKKRKVPDWAIDILKEEFRASEKEVRTYVDILLGKEDGKEELVGIFRDYGVEDEKLKKIRQLG
jgi:hypothetical protein